MLTTSDDVIDGALRRWPLRTPSIVCDDVELFAVARFCDDVDLSETCAGPRPASATAVASDCAYVAGDPINLRDPWGLSAADSTPVGAAPCVIPHVGVCSETPTPAPAPPTPQSEKDSLGCQRGAAGDDCRARRQEQERIRADQAAARAEYGAQGIQTAEEERAEQARQARADEERERSSLWGQARSAYGSAKDWFTSKFGSSVRDPLEGTAQGLGMKQPSFQHMDAIEEHAAGAGGFMFDSAATSVVAAPLAGALRRVGTVFESADDVIKNPGLLRGKGPAEVQAIIGANPGWRVETLGKGAHKGQGWVLREYNPAGNPTGRLIRWHPGGGHHGPEPYWRVSSPDGGTSEIIR